jgi:endonuclease/exonuclease/phosphatase family metal-dependent hydrolase
VLILKVVTINIFIDLSLWGERRWLLVEGLSEQQPDMVAVQEVSIPADNARWLAKQLGFSYVYQTPKMGNAGKKEAIAILSRFPFEDQKSLDLQTQDRVAQYVKVQVGDQLVLVANGHFFWQPGESSARQHQIERLVDRLQQVPGKSGMVICGDFNATPDSTSIAVMRQHFTSVYAAKHGHEPEYTTPTPLPRSKLLMVKVFFKFIRYINPTRFRLDWQGTLDYIFINSGLRVLDSQVVLNQPAPDDPTLYPSDHFGVLAVLEVIQ